MTANWTGSNRCVGTESQSAVFNAFDALASFEDQNNVCRLRADLPANTAASYCDEGRVAPGVVVLANDEDPLAATCAKSERGFHDVRDNGYSVSSGEQCRRNRFFRDTCQLFKYIGGIADAFIFATGRANGRREQHCYESRNCDYGLHIHDGLDI